MHSRRSILAAGALLPCVMSSTSGAQGGVEQTAAEIQRWIEENKTEGYFDPPEVPGDRRGSLILAPDDARVRTAAVFLATVPKDVTPLQAAKWMINNRDEGEAMEWPPDTPAQKNPANPIIVAFFAATRTKPTQGDQTAWCAAFANWTLSHCGRGGTNSAGAVSFRNYGTATTDPRPGDIACFVNTSDPRFGHVGFFDGWAGPGEEVMNLCGGNQKNRLGVDRFAKSSDGLKLHSFRTASGLRT